MSQRKSWTLQEDQLLMRLRKERGIHKWCEIAEIMRVDFGIEGRNGKQCRERFHNHLDSNIIKGQWTHEEDLSLVSLHNEIGNRWAQIARQIRGRTDNCIKNRFYTKLRRSIRLLNECVRKFWKKQFKPLKQSIISKIIEFTDEKSLSGCKNNKNVQKICEDLKTKLFLLSEENTEEADNPQSKNKLHLLLCDLAEFNKDNRRRRGKKLLHSKFAQDICGEEKKKKGQRKGSASLDYNQNTPSPEQTPEAKGRTPSEGQKIEHTMKQCREELQEVGQECNECNSSFSGIIYSALDGHFSPHLELLDMREIELPVQNTDNMWDLQGNVKHDFYL